MDTRYPSIKNSLRVDSKSANLITSMSTKNKRHLFDDNDNVIDRVKYIAAEGSVLTLIGKISYDITNDEFSLTDSLGFIGGGLVDSISTLTYQYF